MEGNTPTTQVLYTARMDVELRHLRALVALADSDTFTTAAAFLGTTQPTLSRTVAQLEKIVGVTLVERTTRTLSFTPAGRKLAADGRRLLAGLEDAITGLRDESGRPLRLGWAWAGLGAHTVSLVQQWRRSSSRPAVEFSRPADPETALRRGRIDAAVIRRPLPLAVPLTDLRGVSLFTESLVAAVGASHPLAGRSTLTLSDLAADPIALCATAPTATLGLWEHCGTTPRSVTVANTDEWLTHIAVGDAVGLTSAATTYSHQHPEVVYRVVEDSPPVDVSLYWPEVRPHPQSAAFADFARDYFGRFISSSAPPMLLTHP